jgi:hypothetical protein
MPPDFDYFEIDDNGYNNVQALIRDRLDETRDGRVVRAMQVITGKRWIDARIVGNILRVFVVWEGKP